MTSYKALVKDVINKADVLLEVVDARFPDETRNSEVEKEIIRLKKPFIIVINKCDLVSKEKLDKTKSRLSRIAPTVFISSKDRSGTTMLRHQILASACIKGRDILVGTLGYPNVGKSSVINGVTGRHRLALLLYQATQKECSMWTQVRILCLWTLLESSLSMKMTNMFRGGCWE